MPSSDIPWAKVTVTPEAVKEISDWAALAGRLKTELDAVRAELAEAREAANHFESIGAQQRARIDRLSSKLEAIHAITVTVNP